MIPREILKKIRQIELRTNRIVTETLAGQYHSVFKGQGMNFDEVREYQPGDDVRAIDWNVTARMNHPFIKKFVEERELTLMLVVDVSGSGLFGSRDQSKRELAAEIASVLAFSAIRNNDKVGLILFSDEVEKFIPPRKGRSHVLRVIREVLFFEPKRRGPDLNQALECLRRVQSHKAITVIVSDFLGSPVAPRRTGEKKAPRPHLMSLESLAQAIARDGEGARKFITILVSGTSNNDGAARMARAIANSPLVKTAVAGSDPNWGRILCAIGYAEGDFAVDTIDVTIGSEAGEIQVCQNGYGVAFCEEKAKEILMEKEIIYLMHFYI